MPKVLAETTVEVILSLSLAERGMLRGFALRDVADDWRKDPAKCERKLMDIAEEVQGLIKRHVFPHADNIDSIRLKVEQYHECGHCRSKWTEVSPDYNGGCCAEDEKNNPDTKAA